jgi:CxxC-x17-CxxC domain-containing protein
LVNETYSDRILSCKDCGTDFVFTAGEQEFYASRGFENVPGRCPSCRAARRAREASSGAASYGGESAGRPSRRVAREMHPAVCSNCGKDTEVPFVPRGDKPVYCSDCFAQVRGTR